MKFENIVRNLEKQGYVIEVMEFSFQACKGVTGTALIDIVNGEVIPTTAKLKEVLEQITTGKSHIQTIEGKKKYLSPYQKFVPGKKEVS